ncbi:hypothetical protein FJZ18_03895 [Candidatus Pacearchaeota archaeon]|nr:hypothetical protein [Candidatus Pacearchaeota archaeon]
MIPKKTVCYHHFFVAESRRKINEPIKDDMTVVPNSDMDRAYENQLGHGVDLCARLYLGGVILYRLDSPCIELFHEQKRGIEKIAKELGFLELIKKQEANPKS